MTESLTINSAPSFPESRYLTLKLGDIYEAQRAGLIPMGHFDVLRQIAEAVDTVRANRQREPLECLIVEKDWPEYLPTLKLLGARVKLELDAIIRPINPSVE